MNSEDFMRKTLPYIKPEYYQDRSERFVFEIIKEYIDKYNSPPSKEALLVEVEKAGDEDLYSRSQQIIQGLSTEKVDQVWLLETTEKFCQEQALVNALRTSAKILDGDRKVQLDKGMIPQLLTEALGVSFDSAIGHDYLDNDRVRFESYHRRETKIPFDVRMLNQITKGGIYRKTLTVLLAGTGVGKSLAMCSFAAANLELGLNVLYITNEMAEEQIGKRIDAHLLDLTMDELDEVPWSTYESRMNKLKSKVKGKLIIKEYPTSTAGAANFRHLLNELRLKKNFIPDIIYVDYLNICVSSRLKRANVNSYEYIKSIAEEIRALAIEFNVPIITATQLNREGYVNSDPGLEHTSESFGLPATADLMLAMVTNEELARLGQILFKQLKNRYRDENLDRRFVVGIDRDKMRFFDLEERAQKELIQEPPPTAQKRGKTFDPSVLNDIH